MRFLLLSVLIGAFTGLVIGCFFLAIHGLSSITLGSPAGQDRLLTLLSPTFGAGVAALLVLAVFRTARGSGVNHTKEAVSFPGRPIPWSAVAGKFLACTVSLGSGNSLGPEDPALHMGAGIGSSLGRLFRLSKKNLRRAAPAGAAAGIAAAFHAPLAAVLFVIEEIAGTWNSVLLGSTVLSAGSAVVVRRWFLGNEPLFPVAPLAMPHPSELLIFGGAGVAGGLLAVLFVRGIFALRQRVRALPPWTRYGAPVLGGLLVGCVGLFWPQVLGASYAAVDDALRQQFPWRTLFAIGLVKMLATGICFGAGTPGGMFAPVLFIGGMIGAGMGGLAHLFWPSLASPVGAYVLVGIGIFFAGVFRAPLASIFMALEVGGSYGMIAPVIVANMVAYLISRWLQPVAFFRRIAQIEGPELPTSNPQREEQPLQAYEIPDAGRSDLEPA